MSVGTDLRVAWRAMRRNPGFSVVAVATLALAIGANTAIFTVVDAILLRPLGYGDESRLFVVHEVVPKFGLLAPLVPVNAMHFLAWRKNVSAFEQAAMIGGISRNLTGSGEPQRLTGARVSPGLFPMLGSAHPAGTHVSGRRRSARAGQCRAAHRQAVEEPLCVRPQHRGTQDHARWAAL